MASVFSQSANRFRRGFTLIELLVVIVIVAIVAGFAVPALAPALKGSALNQSGAMVADQMSFARQYAISQNSIVEVRLYRFGDPEVPGEKADDPTTGHYRGIQFFKRSDSGVWTPASTFVRFPDGAIMNPSARLSTILGEEQNLRYVSRSNVISDAVNHVELPRNVLFNYDYVKFHFQPNGGTDLKPNGNPGGYSAPGGRWHITVHSMDDLPRTGSNFEQAPPNYICWSVDPVTGVGRTYRPGR